MRCNHAGFLHFMTKLQLIKKQAIIRDVQRGRIDEIHALCHEYLRNSMRLKNGQEIAQLDQDELIETVHSLSQAFMWGMDEAVIIHESIAIKEGRDPKQVNQALWPVKSRPK